MRHTHTLRQCLRGALARACARFGLRRHGPAPGRASEQEAEDWLGIG